MKNLTNKWLLLLLLCTVPVWSATVTAKDRKKKKMETAAADSASTKLSAYEKFFKGKKTETVRGMITLHKTGGKLYFEMPVSLFDREMLIGSTVSEISDNKDAIVGAKPKAPLHVYFTRKDSLVQLREANTGYVLTGSNIDRALANNTIGAILKNTKIEVYNNDSTAVVFDMTDFFLGDNKKMPPFDPMGVYGEGGGYKRNETYKSDRSYLSKIKAFDDNVVIKTVLSYVYTLENIRTGTTVVKDRPFTVEMTRSIVLLPETPYRPRMADYRIGIFWSERMKLGVDAATSAPVYFAHRWNLVPSDSAAYRRGEQVDPVKPIVFYIDNTFPEEWKPAIMEGVNQWQELFEAIGLKNAIQAREFPVNDPEFDPDNIKYSCIRYAPITIQNAMGPSWVDPRSGEILTASVYVYHDIIKLVNNWLFIQTSPSDAGVRKVKIPKEKLFDGLRYVISHEIGHCLGFMHNMGASSVIPVDSLRSPSFTAKYGTTVSIMDYARNNYVAQPGDMERGVKLTPPRFGEYDRYLIKWSYTPVLDAATFEEEAAVTTAWISEAIKNPWYRYGKQQGRVLDPRAQAEDLGDDAVAAGRYGVKNLKYIVSNFDQWITEGDEDFTFRMEILENILNQLASYCIHVYNNVGGLYMNEIKSGDLMPRYENIPTAKQKEALNYLFELYGDLDWLDSKDYLQKLPLLGSPKTVMERFLAELILNTPFRVSQTCDVSGKSLSFRGSADQVFRFVWNPTIAGRIPSQSEMDLQKKYVTFMMTAGNFKIPSDQVSFHEAIYETETFHSGCFHENTILSDYLHNPVAGFEWEPRMIFRNGALTQADIYACMTQVKRLLAGKVATSSGNTKSHYELLLKRIELGLK